MQSGGNGDNVKRRQRVQRALADSGRCTHCHPHRGENYGHNGDQHGKFIYGDYANSHDQHTNGFRRSKDKRRK
jgi:hypothetical protein